MVIAGERADLGPSNEDRTELRTARTEILGAVQVVRRGATEKEPMVIDGSAGEGGGQILRTSLTLSMVTGTPFVLEGIRAGRRKPGLMRQHLSCVKAAALICGADVEGASLGSTRIVFRPGPILAGEHAIDIGSAGSTSLVLQTIALPLALAGGGLSSRITLRGGTHARWAPPFPFLEHAWLPLLRRAGVVMDLELLQTGFFPAGGGEVIMTTAPSTLAPLHLAPVGVLGELELRSIVGNLSEGIARRKLSAASERLTGHALQLRSAKVQSAGPGTAMWLVARCTETCTANVFSGIGDVGVPAEEIGRAVAESFLAWHRSGASVEGYLADQLILPIALAGSGSFTTSELTLHARTNLEVVRAFTGLQFRVWDLGGARFEIALEAGA